MQPFLIRDKDNNYFVVLDIRQEWFQGPAIGFGPIRVLVSNKKTKHLSIITEEDMINNYMFERTD